MIRLDDPAQLPADEDPIYMPTGLWFGVKRADVDIVWTDAIRDLRRLRSAVDAWREESQRLTREVLRLRSEIDDILDPSTADYRIDEVTDNGR